MPPDGGVRTPLTVGYNWGSPSGMAALTAAFAPGNPMFGPGVPIAPTDRQPVRLWDYPVNRNTVWTPRAGEGATFAQLKALADGHDLTRLCIETRKDQLERLDWAIRARENRPSRGYRQQRIAQLTEFWERPDGSNEFATWLRGLVEQVLVHDAPACEYRRNRAGELIGLDVVDGATLTCLIDENGRRPAPPAPAFEQVIHGRPWALLTTEQILYRPRNQRPGGLYGYSPVEQIVMTINIAIRRQVQQLQHFTEGNVPAGLISAPDGWSVESIRQFNEWFDSVMAGNTAMRSRLVWGPNGAQYKAFKEAPLKDEQDEWLARVVCYAFNVPPTALVRLVNRDTAGKQQEAALGEGLAPLKHWVKRLVDFVIQYVQGQPDLEFAWLDEAPVDPLEQSQILDRYLKNGIYSVNQAGALVGLPPVPGGDVHRLFTGKGWLPLAEADDSAAAAEAAPASPDDDNEEEEP